MLPIRSVLVLALLSVSAIAQTPSSSTEAANAAPAATQPDSKKLVLVKRVPVVYPAEAMLKRQQGQVVVKVQVSETGDVESAEPVSGEPVFYPAAVDAIKQWKFQPFIRNGSPVKVTTNLTVPFSIDDVLSAVADGDAVLVSEVKGVKRVRVASNVADMHVLQKVPAAAPEFADGHRIFGGGLSGRVELQAVIGQDGKVSEVKELTGPPLLRRAAVDAVRQWRYRPFVWKGEPVEAVTQVTVNFSR